MSASESLQPTEPELAQLRRFNRRLAWLPRFRIRNRLAPLAIQGLLRIGQLGASGKLARRGVNAERRQVSAGGVPVWVRIIRPKVKPVGVVLDFHGGGWVIGNAQMNDAFNIAMVEECGLAVVSVDYRLAVSTPLEGLLDDCFAAACWLLNEDCKKFAGLPVMVVGESAGGHLAAATLLKLKTRPAMFDRIKGAVLYYGVYDLTGSESVRTAGRDTLVLDGPGMVDALRLLTPGLSDQERRQPHLSPLYGDFADFPPALLFVGELDPLRDDTLGIAGRWSNAELHVLPESPHGFIHFPTTMAQKVLAFSRTWMSRRLSAS
ncbi:alpha/beta hydrolase [Pseudomonas sp. JDS28PS106]|uniref:alpha/beta hydrolase n=1 Tax=Pseudomonas sp. JDS28PS106 TaxID=2497235 RepID=UPI002FD49905